MAGFSGFPAQTFEFLEGISENNRKEWFEANRALYEAGYIEPAKAFVAELGPRLRELSPTVRFDPKVNGSIARINRDVRFSKDKRPYKDHLDMWFWHGDRRGWDMPGFWFRLTPQKVHIGTGMHMLEKDMLERFRQSIIHPRSGKALVAAVEEVKAKGYDVGEKTRKLAPRGYETDAERAEFLLFEGLTAGTELPAAAARKADFVEVCVGHYANTWPVARWLIAEVAD